MMRKHFVNLTNGIEAIPDISYEYSFIRIQSTACEQKRWDFLLQDLDYTFLMSLALGHTCVVYDYGARKNVPRAIYQGLEFIYFALNRRWLGKDIIPVVRGKNVYQYFDECYRELTDRTLKKLDYFRKFLLTDEIRLVVKTAATEHDGDYRWYRDVLAEAS